MTAYHFEPLQCGDVQEGDGREVQDQAVDVHSGNTNVPCKLSVPVHPERKVLEVSGQILHVHVRVISRLAE